MFEKDFPQEDDDFLPDGHVRRVFLALEGFYLSTLQKTEAIGRSQGFPRPGECVTQTQPATDVCRKEVVQFLILL